METTAIDTRGMKCPRPLLEVHRAMRDLVAGQSLQVEADDPAFRLDIEAWCHRTGNSLVTLDVRDSSTVATIIKA